MTTTTAVTAPPTTSEPVPDTAPPTTAPPPAPAAPRVALPGDEPDPGPARPARVTNAAVVSTGRIEIPRIGLNHATYEGIEMSIIDRGPSHWPGTAMPGQPGNTVFAGHRVTNSRPFFDIDKIALGDQVIFTHGGGRHVYEVTQTLVVGAGDVWIANPTPGSTFTIFACHPKGSARQRYVVKGRLLTGSGAPGGATPPGGAAPPTTTPAGCLLCGLLGR